MFELHTADVYVSSGILIGDEYLHVTMWKTIDSLSLSFSLHVLFPDAKEAGTDNRNIVDDGKSQKLTRDDIETLKGQGLKGQVHQ